jgi:hypothetical protein
MLKPILNIVTAGIETSYWGTNFCMPVSSQTAACDHRHILEHSFRSSLVLKCSDLNHFIKQANRGLSCGAKSGLQEVWSDSSSFR